jgi:hypothetical protein
MKLLNADGIEQNIGSMLLRSGKSLIDAAVLGNSPTECHASSTRDRNDSKANVVQAIEFDQGQSDSLCAGLNGITTEQQQNSNLFDVCRYFATTTIAANDAGGVQ